MTTPILTKLSVQNFRAIGPAPIELELAPLTVLVGENGSGKSSLLQALAVTAQSALEDPLRSDLILDGSKVSLGSAEGKDYREGYREIYFRKDGERPLSVYFETSIDPREWPAAAAWPKPMGGERPFFADWPPSRVGYRWTRQGIAWPAFSHEFTVDGRPLLAIDAKYSSITEGGATRRTFLTVPAAGGPPDRIETSGLSVDRVLGDSFTRLQAATLVARSDQQSRGLLPEVIEPVRAIASIMMRRLAGVALVEPMRGRQLMHRDVGPEVSFVGPHGEMLVRFLNLLKHRSDERYSTFREWAERFGVRGVETGIGGKNELKVAFRDPQTGTPLELSDAATGSHQALMMAAQVLLSEPGSVLLYEEPENNLHPRFEKLVPALYADAVKTGHQIIATTHSEVLVAAVGNAVRHGLLAESDVAVWEISRTAEKASARRIRVSDRGYLEGWVESFARVEEEMFDEWAKALPEEGKGTDEGERDRRGHASPRRSGAKAKKKPRRSR